MPWRRGVTEEKREMARHLRENATLSERQLWALLRRRGVGGWKFRRQHAIAGYIVDFLCVELALAIEVDGNVHHAQVAEDALRDQKLEKLGITILRIRNHELAQNPMGVADLIARTCSLIRRGVL